MAIPITPQVKSYADSIINYCNQQIALNAVNPADDPAIAVDKLEQISQFTAIRSKAFEFYTL